MIALAFDVETSGLDPKKNAIIEIAMIPVIHGEEKDPLILKIRPHVGAVIEDGALKVNGFTREEIKNHMPPDQALDEIIKFVDSHGGKFFLRGHNAQFDRDFLYHFFSRQGKHIEFIRRFRPELQCTLIKAKSVFEKSKKKPENFKLGTLCKWFSIPLENAHRALNDTVAANKLWDALTAMEGFGSVVTELSDIEKREKYLQPAYVQINPDGSVFINAIATKNKMAIETILAELHEIYC